MFTKVFLYRKLALVSFYWLVSMRSSCWFLKSANHWKKQLYCQILSCKWQNIKKIRIGEQFQQRFSKEGYGKKGETTRLLLAFKYLNNDFFSSMEAARAISKESFSLVRLRKEKFTLRYTAHSQCHFKS